MLGEVIGKPAMLEQLAEECAELSHVALKLARIKRAENPTPVSEETAINNLIEEIADVEICISELMLIGIVTENEIEAEQDRKIDRVKDRLMGGRV